VPVQFEKSGSCLMEEPTVTGMNAMNRSFNKSFSKTKIGLIHHLGHGNLGDDVTLDAVTGNIKSRWPDAVFVAFTLNPADTERRHGIPAYALRRDSKLPPETVAADKAAPRETGLKARVKGWASGNKFLSAILRIGNAALIGRPRALMQEMAFLAESFRAIKSQDLVIMSGGGQLFDSWDGPWGFPYTLFKWTVLARLSGARCYFLNVGAGPLARPLSRWFVRRALGMADYVSFRDEVSRKLVQDLGFRRESGSFPDSAYSFPVPSLPKVRNRQPVVGFSPMAFCDPRADSGRDQIVYDSYIRNLGLFGAWLIREGNRIALFSTDIWFDMHAIEDVRSAIGKETGIADSPSITQPPINGTEAMFSEMSSLDYVVTCRFHGVIFAHLMNKPVLAISTHPKTSTLMAELGLSEYCVEARGCEPEVLRETFLRLAANHDAIKAQMAEKVASYRSGLQAQFDVLFQAQGGGARRISQSSEQQRARLAV